MTLGEGRPTKRRAGRDAGGLPVADSRPQLVDGAVIGSVCAECAYPSAQVGLPWCPSCQSAPMRTNGFAPRGRIWSSTVVHIPVLQRQAPFGLGYVDLDDGPRVVCTLAEPVVLAPGTVVEVSEGHGGDLLASARSSASPSGVPR